MLDKHLIAKTRPIANESNIVYFNDYRITVLADRLFRIEKDSEKLFTDDATQSVWYRDAKEQDFKVKTFADKIEITTNMVKLVVNKDYAKSYAVVNGKKVKLSNKGNLLGTYRTLDGYDGDRYTYDGFKPIELENGVCSKTGLAVLDDKKGLVLDTDGMLKARREQEVDQYIFAFGNDYKGAVKALYDITGYIPKVPRYALGNWWSRYHAYTDTEYLNILDKFEEYDIPLTVATIDMDWHYSDYVNKELKIDETGHRDDKYGCGAPRARSLGWTGYSWNKNLFPDYKSFLKKIEEKNLKITLNLHPKDGVRYFEDMYEEMCVAMGQDPKEERPVEFDLTNDKFINNYFKILHKPYEDDGVAFWWIDWQQGTKSQMAGLDPLWALNHYHYLDNGLNHDLGLVLSRYCEAGSHRYPLGFSADTHITYKTLGYLPYFTATASNIGYTWWSHDIGGHQRGYSEGDLFLRSVQYGIFNPIMRLHSTAMETVTKEPWAYPNGYGALVGDALRYRHALIPYIYSEGVKTSKFGKTLISPLYYEYPDEKLAYKYKNEYFFGEILVNPITTPVKAKSLSSVKAWVPEGVWTDIFTGEVYKAGKGGKEMTLYRFPDSIPAFAKAGSTIVYSDEKHNNDCSNPKNIIFEIYSGNGSYDLYEDDGVNDAITTIKNTSDGKILRTEISFSGALNAMPSGRNIKIRLKNVYAGAPIVYKNGQDILVDAKCDEFVEFIIKDIDYSATYAIEINETPLTALEYSARRFKINIQRFETPNEFKEDLYRYITNMYWSNEEGCLVERNPKVFDGTATKLREICAEFKLADNYIKQRKTFNDFIPKRTTLDPIYIEKLAEGLDD
ncbi:MAG: DUF4968 domain-containing protein [Clostridia bacterium]|nr:DUF4968 domain-containing protein [Clostridia bacterium]